MLPTPPSTFLVPPTLPTGRTRRRARPHPLHATLPSQPAPQPSRRALLHLASLSLLTPLLAPLPSAAARCLPERAASSALASVAWPASWPYTSADFARFDERPDDVFYSAPRLVRHIDPAAVAALTAYYATLLPAARDVLDVCSSVEAYLPAAWPAKRVAAGVGMNDDEMRRNPALTESVVRDLNLTPKLPYSDASFDLAFCNVSIDYLTKPREVVSEMRRVLRKGGKAVISFSDRVFGTKAVAIWMAGGDQDHVYTVGAYLHFAGGFGDPDVIDLTPRKAGKCTGDPLYVVTATKL